MDNVVDLDGTVFKGLVGLLGGGVGTNVNLDGALLNHGAVDLIGDAIDLLEVVGVRDDLVAGDDILYGAKEEAGLAADAEADADADGCVVLVALNATLDATALGLQLLSSPCM